MSLTSYPDRIRFVWATVTTLLNQLERPDAIVLVLAKDEFGQRRLPNSIQRLKRRGLEIFWSNENHRSYNKLIPARRHFPNSIIITVDDDFLYNPELVGGLLSASNRHPGFIVGNRGWDPRIDDGALLPYVEWMRAGRAGPTGDAQTVFLTGVGGILYPPNLACEPTLLDIRRAKGLAPSADDVWFWASAVDAGVPRLCLGRLAGITNGREEISRTLFSENKTANDNQIAAVVDHFGIRPRLGLEPESSS